MAHRLSQQLHEAVYGSWKCVAGLCMRGALHNDKTTKVPAPALAAIMPVKWKLGHKGSPPCILQVSFRKLCIQTYLAERAAERDA